MMVRLGCNQRNSSARQSLQIRNTPCSTWLLMNRFSTIAAMAGLREENDEVDRVPLREGDTETAITGAPSNAWLKLSVSIVAEVTMIFSSGRW